MTSLRYGILCLLLCFAIFLLALKNYEVWTHPIEWPLEKGGAKKGETKAEGPPATAGRQKEKMSMESYIMIAEKNIFSPERKEFAASMTAKPVARPQVILYGVTIFGNYQSASVVNPGRPLRKGEREMMTLKIGDRIGDYRLAKILPDRITMEAGGDTFEVFLFEPSMPKQRTQTKTESRPATITSVQTPSPGSSPSQPASAIAPQPTPPAAIPQPAAPRAERPQEPAQGRVITPTPPYTTPIPPSVSSTPYGRRRIPAYPAPTGTPTQETGGQ